VTWLHVLRRVGLRMLGVCVESVDTRRVGEVRVTASRSLERTAACWGLASQEPSWPVHHGGSLLSKLTSLAITPTVEGSAQSSLSLASVAETEALSV
jgi:hypothetical protein